MRALLIAASLGVNLVLVAALALRPDIAPPRVRDFLRGLGATASEARATPPPPAPVPPRPRGWTLLYHEDPAAFIARLRAAGFPASVIRGLVTADIQARFDARIRALQDPEPGAPFWKARPAYYRTGDKRMEEINQLMRERTRLIRDALKDDFFASDDVTEAQRRQFGNLSRSKVDALQRIEDDYNEMNSAARAAAAGLILPEDQAKFDLLAREKQADLAAVLTPEELDEYNVRSSPITRVLRSRLGEFTPSEPEFRVIYAAHQALNERLAPIGLQAIDDATRREAERDYLQRIRAELGEVRFWDFLRQTSDEYTQLSRIAERNNLPRDTPAQIFTVREHIWRESNRIYDDRNLNTDAKRAALQTLAQTSRVEMQRILGPGAAPSYLKIAEAWLGHVERGAAISFGRASTLTVATEQRTFGFGFSPDYRWLPKPQPAAGR